MAEGVGGGAEAAAAVLRPSAALLQGLTKQGPRWVGGDGIAHFSAPMRLDILAVEAYELLPPPALVI